MFLKNYTSAVPVSVTIQRIEKVLIRCGVRGIMKEYLGVSGEIAALTFQIEAPSGSVTIRLPVDKSRALDALWKDYAGDGDLNSKGDALIYGSRKRRKRDDFAEQAERTAWKIMQDWVEVQMSMIHMQQAEVLQVFLPYVYDGKRTYYQALRESSFRGLLPEKTENGQ